MLTEVDHLAKTRFESQARIVIIEFILGQARQSRFQIPETGLEPLSTARLLQQQYASLDLDLADAVTRDPIVISATAVCHVVWHGRSRLLRWPPPPLRRWWHR